MVGMEYRCLWGVDISASSKVSFVVCMACVRSAGSVAMTCQWRLFK